MSHELQSADYSQLLAPATAATTARTANLDCQGANYATIVVGVSAEANTNSTNVVFALSESDDTTASNFATFDANFNVTIDNTAAARHICHVSRKGRKRYLRVTVTPDTTTNGAVISYADAILAKEYNTAIDSESVAG